MDNQFVYFINTTNIEAQCSVCGYMWIGDKIKPGHDVRFYSGCEFCEERLNNEFRTKDK